MSPLRVLITNLSLSARSGTETYARDLAVGLFRRGHAPAVYSPMPGAVADEIRAAGVAVVADLAELTEAPDVVHGHHHPETMAALAHFPRTPGVFVCHDRFSWHDHAPLFPRLLRHVAVDLNCRERLVEDGVPQERIAVVHNGVDLRRFRPRGPLPRRPARALLFSNYAREETHLGPAREACLAAGLPLDVMGAASGRPCAAPEGALGAYDVVFAKARCALEAMAVGCAVVLCDDQGAGPLVRSGEWPRLRAWNFGRRVCDGPLTAEALLAQVARYDADDAAAVCRLTRESAGVEATIDALVAIYREVIDEHAAGHADPDKEGRAMASYLRGQRPYPLMYRLANLDHELTAHRRSADFARAGWEEARREGEAQRRAAEEARAGWAGAHQEAEMLRAAHAEVSAAVAQGEAALARVTAEGQAWRRQCEALQAALERTLSRRIVQRVRRWLRVA